MAKLRFNDITPVDAIQAYKDIRTLVRIAAPDFAKKTNISIDAGDFNSLLPLVWINAQKAYYAVTRKKQHLDDYLDSRRDLFNQYRIAKANGETIEIGDKVYGPFGPKRSIIPIPTFTKDRVHLVVITDDPGAREVFKKVTLPVVPVEFDFNPDSNFVSLPSSGRNTPRYCYAGSEDTLTFSVDWFLGNWQNITNKNDINVLVKAYEEIIEKARLLESMTKGDGYKSTPPIIQIVWGSKKNLFKGDKWILTKAPYKATGFNNGFVMPFANKAANSNIEASRYGASPVDQNDLESIIRAMNNQANYHWGNDFINTNLFPTQITQTLEFKKVHQRNPYWKDIQYVDGGTGELINTKGPQEFIDRAKTNTFIGPPKPDDTSIPTQTIDLSSTIQP